MSTTELKLPFATEKLDALRFFMEKKEQTIEQELKDYLDKIYERVVPVHVREYVESRIDREPVREQASDAEQTSATRERTPRPSRRQREQTAADMLSNQEAQTETGGPAEEETQGMNMSM